MTPARLRPVRCRTCARRRACASSRFRTHAFDGNWSVLIVTEAARATGLSLWPFDPQRAVFYEGSASVNVAGRVSGRRHVDVRVSAGSQGASGTGRLSRG